jgi:hypothetical protein
MRHFWPLGVVAELLVVLEVSAEVVEEIWDEPVDDVSDELLLLVITVD